MLLSKNAFKAYDIRGVVPQEVNEELAYRVGRVFAAMFAAERVVVGHDIRLTGPALSQAVSDGLRDGGCDVIDIGQCGTEQVYFAVAHLQADGGIMVTASHNPADYNGMKLVRSGARPVSAETGLQEICEMVTESEELPHLVVPGKARGRLLKQDIMDAYVQHLLSYIDVKGLKRLKLVANCGNGGAGAVVKKLAEHLPFDFVWLNDEPDGTFPNGVPNPLLEPNREATAAVVRAQGADMGIAWDGDFDRCFFFDEKAEFIEGYYVVGLLAESFLRKHKDAKIMYDPRLTWNTLEIIAATGGIGVRCKSGHAFMKECMRLNDVVYGGEMSAHHYFKDFSFCDSGMLPWLLVTEMVCNSGKALSALVGERMLKFPCSGEINRKVADSSAVLAAIETAYAEGGSVDKLDGLSIEYSDWRFNIRVSNTEPVMRLNVETRGDKILLATKTKELLAVIGGEEA